MASFSEVGAGSPLSAPWWPVLIKLDSVCIECHAPWWPDLFYPGVEEDCGFWGGVWREGNEVELEYM